MGAIQQIMLAGNGGNATAVTWNPSDKATEITLSGGNLIAGRTSATGWKSVRATLARSAGKYYCEAVVGGTSGSAMIGLVLAGSTVNDYPGSAANDTGYLSNGDKYTAGIQTSAWGASYTTGDVIGIAYDAGTGNFWFSKNNVWQHSGDPATGLNAAGSFTSGSVRYPMVALYQDATSRTWTGHFKASDLTYSPPTGFSSWQ